MTGLFNTIMECFALLESITSISAMFYSFFVQKNVFFILYKLVLDYAYSMMLSDDPAECYRIEVVSDLP